jgi:methylaspartate ammonia-lyase
MKVNSVGSNQTEIELHNGNTVLYSYSTPVAAFVPGRGGLCTSTKYSATTSRHISKAMARWGCNKTVVDQSEIDEIANMDDNP